ncbi:unnamed protein product [[Candida] boidinii]|nr:unnamed protein product [[Candida] boidinii]
MSSLSTKPDNVSSSGSQYGLNILGRSVVPQPQQIFPHQQEHIPPSSSSGVKPLRKKSKTGCTCCKLRKVKCDETHPNCINCMKRGIQCIYGAQSKDQNNSKLLLKKKPGMSNDKVALDPNSPANGEMSSVGPYSIKNFNDLSYNYALYEEYLLGYGGSLSQSTTNYLLSLTPGSEIDIKTGRFVLPSQTTKDLIFCLLQLDNTLDSDIRECLLDENISNEELQKVMGERRKFYYQRKLQLYSRINFEFVEYFTTQYYFKLSENNTVQKGYLAAFGLSHKYEHMLHLFLALISLDFYQNGSKIYIEQKQGKNTSRPRISDSRLKTERKDYLKLSQYHHAKSLELFHPNSKPKSIEEALTSTVAALLQLVYYSLSPDYKMTDPAFFKLAAGLSYFYQSGKPVYPTNTIIHKAIFTVAHHEDLSKYRLNQSQIFFPRYITDLLSLQPFEEGGQSASVIELHINNYHDYYITAINDLFVGYKQVFNTELPEHDFIAILTRWIIDLPSEFQVLIGMKDSRALIIFAHYIMLLQSMVPVDSWNRLVMNEELKHIDLMLEKDWKPWLNVPYYCASDLASNDDYIESLE